MRYLVVTSVKPCSIWSGTVCAPTIRAFECTKHVSDCNAYGTSIRPAPGSGSAGAMGNGSFGGVGCCLSPRVYGVIGSCASLAKISLSLHSMGIAVGDDGFRLLEHDWHDRSNDS